MTEPDETHEPGAAPLGAASRRLRRRLASGPAYGVFLVSGSAMLAEAAGHADIDWAVIDMEAGALSRADALHSVQALAATGVPTVVRVPEPTRNAVEYALDLGVSGVMVPKVDRVEDAERAAAYTRYPPRGSRGVNAIRANAYYTRSDEYFRTADDDTLCLVQIESAEAVANVDKIAATDGVDMLFIGANDLAMDLGQPGSMTGPRFDAARAAVLAAAASEGKTAGIFAYTTKLARQYAKEGFRFIAVGNEVKNFVQSTAMTVGLLRK